MKGYTVECVLESLYCIMYNGDCILESVSWRVCPGECFLVSVCLRMYNGECTSILDSVYSGFKRVYAGERFTGGKYGWKCIKENV